jgi:glycosyltransferase involved in cell wall biosynthesis
MRIAFISVSGHMGGSEVVLQQMLEEFRTACPSWDLHLIVPSEGPLAGGARARGVQVAVVPMPPALARLGEWGAGLQGRRSLVARYARAAAGLPLYERRLRRTLRTIAPTIIHSNGFKAHITAARVRDDAALVWHMHEYVSSRPVSRSLLRYYASECGAIVAVSESVAADVRRHTDDPTIVRVVHNGIDLDRFSPSGPVADLDRLAGFDPPSDGTVRVGFMATFSRWKGHGTFLEAISRIPPSCRIRAYVIGDAVYDTAGSQHTRAELEAMAAALGLAGRVGFTGFIHESDRAIRALDVAVHASTEPEAFGLVIAEAMACGRAVVTSGIGGAGELVRDGEDALLHRPGDADDLARRIEQLAGDGALRSRMGLAARATAERRFDARARLAMQFRSVYEEATRAVAVAR